MNFWNTEYNSENAKAYLVNFAKSKNLDPLIADTWYNISGELLQQRVLIIIRFIYNINLYCSLRGIFSENIVVMLKLCKVFSPILVY